jgi:AcrR family transcriptional regulator
MEAAVNLIATGGVSAATPAAVASDTGVARTALLYHFPDRPGFLQALASHLAGEMAALFDVSKESSARKPPTVLLLMLPWIFKHQEQSGFI